MLIMFIFVDVSVQYKLPDKSLMVSYTYITVRYFLQICWGCVSFRALFCVIYIHCKAKYHTLMWSGCVSSGKNLVLYRVSHELRSLLRESVPYVKLYRYNPKHLHSKLNGFGDNGKRMWGLVWFPCTVASVTPYTSTVHEIRNHPHNISSATG